jgi:hypothetical protein
MYIEKLKPQLYSWLMWACDVYRHIFHPANIILDLTCFPNPNRAAL